MTACLLYDSATNSLASTARRRPRTVPRSPRAMQMTTTSTASAARSNTALVMALTIAATLGGLLFGYDTAVISGATDAITHNFVEPRHLSEGDANFLSGLAISIALLGCVVGAAIAGPISTRIGRKAGLLIAGVLFFVSSLGAGYPEFI